MLNAVLFIRCVWKYAGEVREIYSFFSLGKKREGKSSFCIFFGKRVGQNTKSAFPFAVAHLLCFVSVKDKIFSAIIKILNFMTKILFAISNFIVSVYKILFDFGNSIKDYDKILFSFIEYKFNIVKSKTAKLNFVFDGFIILFSLSNFKF